MGKTWKKKNGHVNHVGDWSNKGYEQYGHNFRSNSYRRAYREFTEADEDYPKMRRGAVPPETWQDQKAGGKIRPNYSRFNHRSLKKAKEQRRLFEESL